MDDLSKAKTVVVVSFFVAVALFIKLCIFGYSGKRRFIKKAYVREAQITSHLIRLNMNIR